MGVPITPQPEMTPEAAFARLQVWFGKQKELAELKTEEVLERKSLAGYYFPTPEEGTNRIPLGGGFDLMLKHGIKRNVDEAALDNVKPAEAKRMKLNLDELFPTKRVLSVAVYRTLSDEQRKFVDSLLDISDDGTPQMHIVPQADTAGQQRHADAAEEAAPAKKRRGKKAAAAEPEQTTIQLDVVPFNVVSDATKAQPDDYYTQGGQWWQLSAQYQWVETTDPNLNVTVAQAAPDIVICSVAEDGEEGNYYTDGEGSWWQLLASGDELEWVEVSTPSAVKILEDELVRQTGTAKPKRTRRKRKGAEE